MILSRNESSLQHRCVRVRRSDNGGGRCLNGSPVILVKAVQSVIPAKAGINSLPSHNMSPAMSDCPLWIPAFAGMTTTAVRMTTRVVGMTGSRLIDEKMPLAPSFPRSKKQMMSPRYEKPFVPVRSWFKMNLAGLWNSIAIQCP